MPSMSNAMDNGEKRRKLNTTTTNENYSILGKRKINEKPNNGIERQIIDIVKRLRTITEAKQKSSCLEVLKHTVKTINRKDLLIRELKRRNKEFCLIIGKPKKYKNIKLQIDLRYDNEMQRLEKKNQTLSKKISSLFGTINNLERKLAEQKMMIY